MLSTYQIGEHLSSLFDNDLVTVVTSAVRTVSTTTAVVVGDICIGSATLAPLSGRVVDRDRDLFYTLKGETLCVSPTL
jgi:hypothetical protein